MVSRKILLLFTCMFILLVVGVGIFFLSRHGKTIINQPDANTRPDISLYGGVSATSPNQPLLNYPLNESTGIELNPMLNITVVDGDGDKMNVTFWSEVVSIAAGLYHTCALTDSRSLMCWGYNNNGQIGNGSSGEFAVNPVFVNSTESFISITAGGYNTCGLLSNGSAMCWGNNGDGQIGNGSSGGNASNPTFVNTSESFVSITSGSAHTCGLLSNGSAMCWGDDYYGQIGNGVSGVDILNPIFVDMLGKKSIWTNWKRFK